jgi:hypothetical protein
MELETHLHWIVLVIVYTAVLLINVYAMILYRKACMQMKRTPIIKSIYYFLAALLFENLYFWITATARAVDSSLGSVLEYPLLWAIPKIILGISLLYFIWASLSPQTPTLTEELHNLKECGKICSKQQEEENKK